MYLCEVAIVSQLCISFPYILHGLCEDYLICDIAFNAVMPLSRASTRGRYSRIEGVTKDKAALPVGGVAGSHDDRASVDAPRPSQEARDRQRHGTHGTIRLLDPNRVGGSRDAQGQHARQRAGASEARLPGRNTAPSNIVVSPSISRSSHRSP